MANSYLPLVLIVIGTVVLLSHFGNCQKRPLALGPASFQERQDRRKRQAKPGPNKGRTGPPGHEEGNQILTVSIRNCEEDGMIFMNGYPDSYYVKCVRNAAHGGFYRVIYICPRDSRSQTDSTVCVPPPDCASSCGNNNQNHEAEANSLV